MLTPEDALQILSEVCRVPVEELTPDKRLIQDLDLDSMLTLELLMTLEERLGSDISEVDAAGLVTVGDVLEFIEERSGA
jgi:acyl carrier protein